MLLIQVHQLHLVVGHLLLVWRLEHEGNCVSIVLSLHGQDIISTSTLHNFGHAEKGKKTNKLAHNLGDNMSTAFTQQSYEEHCNQNVKQGDRLHNIAQT